MITVKVRGNFDRTTRYLKKLKQKEFLKHLDRYGEMGVHALMEATPVDTGKTAMSWNYTIEEGDGYTSIVWRNSNVVKGISIAVLLQYGHGTRNGGYVQGRDYINPAMQPIFDKIAEDAWMEVVSL